MSLSDLPGELILRIVDEALLRPPEQESTGTELAPIRDALEIAKVSKIFKLASDNHRLRHFNTFVPCHEPTVKGVLQPWLAAMHAHPDGRQFYWEYHMGDNWPNTSNLTLQLSAFESMSRTHLRSARIDCRLEGYAEVLASFAWSLRNLTLWFDSCKLLNCLLRPNPNLRFFHVRLSAQPYLLDQLQTIIAGSPQLTEIVIECDSHPEAEGHDRPILRLSELCNEGIQYAHLERFIVRAPAVHMETSNGNPFLSRLKHITTMCFAMHSLFGTEAEASCLMKLLRSGPSVKQMEFSFYRPQPRSDFTPTGSIDLPQLTQFKLELGEIDARLLVILRAPKLEHLQFRSKEELGRFGSCVEVHFPSLLSATVWCPGSVIERFKVLGLNKRQFLHNLHWTHLLEENWDYEILVYVKSYQPPENFVCPFPFRTCRRVRARSISSGTP
ncbi:hypothetical protein CF319_g7017 [Tilletia indica]|nr:hypothetical protein CF319_g7017 [Tilletia indica]